MIVSYDTITTMTYRPPFTLTTTILKLAQNISWKLGAIAGQKIDYVPLQLRREPKIQTIQASLAIEGNTLSLEQVTALINGKRILGPFKDILEVQNAISVYEKLHNLNPLLVADLLKSHKILMAGLIQENGKFRDGNVGIFKGKVISHVAPPAKKLPELMKNLFEFLNQDKEISWLLKACIFHYEFELIHPFSDGNGRMGRLWQQLILMKEDSVFEVLPIEVIIKEHQENYYNALGESDKTGESTPFIEFSLEIILKSLNRYTLDLKPNFKTTELRLHYAQAKFGNKEFGRKDYAELHNEISTATASRDLLNGLRSGQLISTGQKNQTRYQFKTFSDS